MLEFIAKWFFKSSCNTMNFFRFKIAMFAHAEKRKEKLKCSANYDTRRA